MNNSVHEKQIIEILSINFRNNAEATRLTEEHVKPINWTALIEDKSIRKLLPLVYFTLKKNNLLEYVSKDALDTLKNYYLSLTKQNLLLFNELSIVLCELAKNDI